MPAWVALDGNDIVGYIGAMFVECQTGSARRPAAWLVDGDVLPRYQGYGIGAQLFSASMERHEVVLALAMVPTSRHLLKKYGAVDGPDAKLYAFTNFLEPHRMFNGVRPSLERRLGESLGRVVWGAVDAVGAPWAFAKCCEIRLRHLQELRAEPCKPMDVTVKPVPGRFGPEADRLWDSSASQFGVAVARGQEYLNWKYVDQPGPAYECFYGYLGSTLAGLVVLRLSSDPEPRVGVIADVVWTNGNDAVVVDLLRFALDYLNRSVPSGVYCASSVPAVTGALERLGFLYVESYTSCICIRDPSGTANRPTGSGPMLLAMGDHDWDQYPSARHLATSQTLNTIRTAKQSSHHRM